MKNLRLSVVVAALAIGAVVYDRVQPQAQGGFSDQRNVSPSASTGTANAQIVVLSNYGRQTGVTILFTPGLTNTGSTTVNINNTGAGLVKRITTQGYQNLVGGEFIANTGPVAVLWDGGNYVLTNRSPDEIGQTRAFRNITIPGGYLIEDGSCVSQTTYAGLFTAIGATYGSCGAGLFKLPDSRGRVPAALDNQGSNGAANILTASGSGCTATALTGTGCGAQNNALNSINQVPQFTPTGSVSVSTPSGTVNVNDGRSFGIAGSQTANNPSSAGTTWSLAGGVGFGPIGGQNNVVITGGSISASFSGNPASGSFSGNAVGSASPSAFTTLPPVTLLRLAIKA